MADWSLGETDDKGPRYWADRVLIAGEHAGLKVCLFGSLACWVHCTATRGWLETAAMPASDIDLVAEHSTRPALLKLLRGLGFTPDPRLETVPGARRSVLYRFEGSAVEVRCDVYYDELRFCHLIDLRGRLGVESTTIPLAELVLSKLQIREMTAKDLLHLQMLFCEHPLGDGDSETINIGRITQLCRADWGLYQTVCENIRLLTRESRTRFPGEAQQQQATLRRLRELQVALTETSKSALWHLRGWVQRGLPWLRWYEDVEEFGLSAPQGGRGRR